MQFILGCSNHKDNRLVVDELYLSIHEINSKDFIHSFNNACSKGIIINEYIYHPSLIVKIDSNGKLSGYLKYCGLNYDYSIETNLDDSILNIINKKIKNTNYNNLDSIYFNGRPSVVIGAQEYYLYLRKGNSEKRIFIYNGINYPQNVMKLFDFLDETILNLRLLDNKVSPFRRDSIVVVQSEKYRSIIRRIKLDNYKKTYNENETGIDSL